LQNKRAENSCNSAHTGVVIDSVGSESMFGPNSKSGENSMRFFGPLFLIGTLCFGSFAFAGDLEWNGLYRIEGYSIDNPGLSSSDQRAKQYGLHHLILRPRIVAGDGIYIRGQFHILNAENSETFRGGPQLGSVWGNGLGGTNPTDASNSSALSRTQQEEFLSVSQFYLTMNQEFGSLIVGRAPLEFGLGMAYNAGQDLFDHFYVARDLVGYKVVMGNFYFTPMYAKISEGGLAAADDVTEMILQVQYENPETQTAMGVMYNDRGSSSGSDTPTADPNSGIGAPFEGGTATELNLKTLSLYYRKAWEGGRLGFEMANLTGDYGVSGIEANGFGAVIEYESNPIGKKMNWGIKAGWASGDDPRTANEYEGFAFDQNYDLGILMFNHALGRNNLLKTQTLGTRFGDRRGGTNTVDSTIQDADIEAVSNAYFVAPKVTYKWRDRWNIEGLLVAGWLAQADIQNIPQGTNTTVDKALGYELDLSLVFKPNERFVWENTLALLSPGAAFEFGGAVDTAMAYGIVSRAAISF